MLLSTFSCLVGGALFFFYLLFDFDMVKLQRWCCIFHGCLWLKNCMLGCHLTCACFLWTMQNAMISSIVQVTNLPRKKVVKWFEDKRNEDGIPEHHQPYQRSVSETVFSNWHTLYISCLFMCFLDSSKVTGCNSIVVKASIMCLFLMLLYVYTP